MSRKTKRAQEETKRSHREREFTNNDQPFATDLGFPDDSWARINRLNRDPLPQDDRRTFHPDGIFRRILQNDLRPALIRRVPVSRRLGADRTIDRPAFANPKRVKVCQQRKARRRSLFASGKAGRGRKIFGRRKQTYNSQVKC